MWKNKATIVSFLPHLFWVGVFFCIGYQQRTQYQPIFRETDKSLVAGGRMLDSFNQDYLNYLKKYLIKHKKLAKPIKKKIQEVNHRTEAMLQYLKQEDEMLSNKAIFWNNQKVNEIADNVSQFYEDILTIYEETISDSLVKEDKPFIVNRIKGLKLETEIVIKENSFLFEKESSQSDSSFQRKKITTKQVAIQSIFNRLAFEIKEARNMVNFKIGDLSFIFCGLNINPFFPIMKITKGYCKIGEEHKMTVAWGSFSYLRDNYITEKPFFLTVNNTVISFDANYIGRYAEPTTTTGKHTLHLKAQVYNPKAKKNEQAESTFEYTVAEKPLIIRTPLQTVLYKGIQQPIYFRGLDETILKVSSAGGKITAKKGDYFITPYTEDSLEVILETKEETRIFVFKVKPLPYPIATLSNKISDGTVSIAAFQELSRQPLGLIFKDLEGKVSAKITNFTLTKVSGSADIIETPNTGNKLCAAARNLVQTAKKGDIFVYENITVQIAGEATERVLAPLIFKVE